MNVDELRPLLQLLGPEPERIEEALAEAGKGSATEVLERCLRHLGFHVRWFNVSPRELVALARPDLPLVAWSGEPGVGAWMIDRASLGQLRSWRSGMDRRWLRPEQVADMGRWARVEPVLPASWWAGPDGVSPSPTQRLLGLLRSEASDVAVVSVYAGAVGVLSLATPLAIQVLINQLAFGVVLQPILFLGVALLGFLTLAAVLRVAQRLAVEVIQRRVFVRAVADLAGRFTRLRIDALDGRYAPELANRFFDVLTLQKATSALLLDGFTAALQAMVGFAILALYHPALLVFDVLAVGLVAMVLWPLGMGAEDSAIKESKAKYAVAGWLEELARHPLVFKLGPGSLGSQRADALTRTYLGYRAKHFGVFFRQFAGMQAVQVLLQVVLLVSCGWLVLEGQLTLGQLVAAEFIVASALAGASKFTDKLETVYDLLAGIDKLGTLLDLPAELPGGLRRSERAGPAALALDGVSMRGEPHWSLDVSAGDCIGIFGVSGVGKSRLAEVLAGARRAPTGRVLRDGRPTERLSADERFDEVAVLRTGAVVQGTLLDNLTLGARRPPDQVQAAVEAVGLAKVVESLPQGLDTHLGVAGEPLSESQVVDLLVARALLARPRLAICDSLLDGVTPAHRDRLLAVLREGTTLVVLTEDEELARRCGRCVALTAEGLR